MYDYLQEMKQNILDKMAELGIVDGHGNILDEQKYIDWLTEKEKRIQSQIRHHAEPGGYELNLLYKDMEVVQEMLRTATGAKESDHEQEIMERFSNKQEKRNVMLNNLKQGMIRLFTWQRRTPTPERGKQI